LKRTEFDIQHTLHTDHTTSSGFGKEVGFFAHHPGGVLHSKKSNEQFTIRLCKIKDAPDAL
jgi:hypothetical protein